MNVEQTPPSNNSRGLALSRRRSRTSEEELFVAGQWQLMWLKFQKHKLAMVGTAVLIVIYLVCFVFAEFFAPYDIAEVHSEYGHLPPQKLHFVDSQGRFHLRPFVYGLFKTQDPVTWENVYTEDPDVIWPIRFFVRGEPYKFWGLWSSDLHFFGVEEGVAFLSGTDLIGRDMLSRTISGARISLSIGFLGVGISFVLGNILGGVSGFYGGIADMIIQRVIEFLSSMPTIPLWMALAAALPAQWPPLRVYFGITIILSFLGWTGLARVVRGKLLELREEDFVMAAQLVGATDFQIIVKHLLPSFASYLIVSMTLSVPSMILSETALSFLGLGLRAPVVSLGVLLEQAQSFQTVANNPWLLYPGILVVLVVLCFNFMGDGLRDAADPYR